MKKLKTGVNTANNKQNKDSKKQPNQSMINHYNHTTDTTQKKNMKNTIDETKVVSNKSTHNINIYEPSEYYYVQNTNGYPNNCCITSLATVVSHNTNQKIEPNNKNISVEKININNKEYPRNNLDGSDYNSNKKGYNSYSCTSITEIIGIAESELNNNRWVQVYTEYENKANDQHWVTITGFDGKSSYTLE